MFVHDCFFSYLFHQVFAPLPPATSAPMPGRAATSMGSAHLHVCVFGCLESVCMCACVRVVDECSVLLGHAYTDIQALRYSSAPFSWLICFYK